MVFQRMQKSKFRFEYCWNKMKHYSKWIKHMSQGSTKRKLSLTYSSSDTINLGDEDNTAGDFVDLERPIGQKKAKEEAKKGKGKAKDTSQFDATFCKWTDEKLKVDQAKLELAKQLLEIQKNKTDIGRKRTRADADQARANAKQDREHVRRTKEEITIMMMDVSSLTGVKREYVEGLQANILARSKSNL